ncbi:TPA: DUF2591 family protein [Klebsiella aerogenes]|nr:DUF2591 family protein [Klebsiella aerogenes]
MDYSKLSDFEIDKAVADALGFDYDIAIMFVSPVDKINGNHVEEYVRKKITSNEKHRKRFSPTRIPNDAWSIIVGNEISLISRCANGEWKAQLHLGREDIFDSYASCWDKNPLRAAMIVFLMMQEAK